MPRGGKRKGAGRPSIGGRLQRQFSLDDDTVANLDRLVADRGTNASAVVRDLIADATRELDAELDEIDPPR